MERETQILEDRFFTKGRVIVRGKSVTRGKAKKADHILFYKPKVPLAAVEAMDNNHSIGAGIRHPFDYAETLFPIRPRPTTSNPFGHR